MARTAIVRSASLAPNEAEIVDQLASQLTAGSFTDLTRLFITWFGAPLHARLLELAEAGIDPNERLVVLKDGSISVEKDLEDFYHPVQAWPPEGPKGPPCYSVDDD